MYENDPRTVLTLDAGGTNFVFSAISGCREVVKPIRLDAVNDDVEKCLAVLVKGFRMVEAVLAQKPVAISFAFPGPADYGHGIIGDLVNFPCFRGGVAMGPYLEEVFGIPVFINNDGNLFAYGEALSGALPSVNAALEQAGSTKRYRNLLGLTYGTGFGAGVVIDGVLLTGDNGCGGDVWCMRNICHPELIAEEGSSIRAVTREYHCAAPDDARDLTPKDIFDIAEGRLGGNADAARQSFASLGRVSAEAVVSAMDIVDGLIVVGGGLSGAYRYFVPSMLEVFSETLGIRDGGRVPFLQMKVVDLMDGAGMKEFLTDRSRELKVPGTDRSVRYMCEKKTGITLSKLGTSTAIAVGAYAFALSHLSR